MIENLSREQLEAILVTLPRNMYQVQIESLFL